MNHDTSIRSQLPISTGNCRRNTINSLLFLLSLSQISLASNTHSDHTFKPVYRTTPLSFEKKCSLCLPLYLSWLSLPRVSFFKKNWYRTHSYLTQLPAAAFQSRTPENLAGLLDNRAVDLVPRQDPSGFPSQCVSGCTSIINTLSVSLPFSSPLRPLIVIFFH